VSECRSVGVSDCRGVGVSECRSVGVSECRGVGVSECRSVGACRVGVSCQVGVRWVIGPPPRASPSVWGGGRQGAFKGLKPCTVRACTEIWLGAPRPAWRPRWASHWRVSELLER
jgi:hypothetical protein